MATVNHICMQITIISQTVNSQYFIKDQKLLKDIFSLYTIASKL